ncbi:unnamed protein product [Caenorhabditis auriculariae]|uniref:C2H2-type domain-containing protein n=1 Tax=Caenorhabditis auriculariae TaxID=2777116 RepID=A0A8S1H5S7_9PELO|nr:unnamed protein product [Caenorhabditis auriculariae]
MSTTDDDQGLDVVDVGDAYMGDVKLEFNPTETKRNTGARYLCPYGCGKLVALRTIDYHKNNGCGRRMNESLVTNPDIKKRYYCCGVCFTEFVTRQEFHAHLRIEHDVHPEIHHVNFKDRATFDRFLRWLEMEGGAHFRHKSGSKRRGRGKGIFLACNRSGYVSSSSNSDPARDRTGPFRLGFSCTAFVHGTEHEDGHVSADVCGDHYGHDSRMRLPNVIKYIIGQKQLDGEPSSDIIAYLRDHFTQFASENIFAQRICFVDNEELKNIYACNTKKWETRGVPTGCEIWEEELLDRAGITRNGAQRLRAYNEKTTQELALDEDWPRPRVFVAKIRSESGMLVPLSDPRLQDCDSSVQATYFSHQPAVDTRYVEMEEVEYADENFEHIEEEVIQDGAYEMKANDDGLKVPVNVIREEQVETVVRSSHDHAVDEPQTITVETVDGKEYEEYVRADGTEMQVVLEEDVSGGKHSMYMETMQNGHAQNEIGQHNLTDQILIELDEFRETLIEKRATGVSLATLRSSYVRLRSIHSALISDKPGENATVIYPQDGRASYRPGRVASSEHEELRKLYSRGDVTLLPIEDELSDDEPLAATARHGFNYNPNFWS